MTAPPAAQEERCHQWKLKRYDDDLGVCNRFRDEHCESVSRAECRRPYCPKIHHPFVPQPRDSEEKKG